MGMCEGEDVRVCEGGGRGAEIEREGSEKGVEERDGGGGEGGGGRETREEEECVASV